MEPGLYLYSVQSMTHGTLKHFSLMQTDLSQGQFMHVLSSVIVSEALSNTLLV